MKKNLTQVIEQLDLTIANMKTLKESEFDYSRTITEYDLENSCGTVCCVCGYYPKWYPDSAFNWVRYEGLFNRVSLAVNADTDFDMIANELAVFHGFSLTIVKILFAGYSTNKYDFEYHSSFLLPDVIERFEKMRKLLASGEITPMQDF